MRHRTRCPPIVPLSSPPLEVNLQCEALPDDLLIRIMAFLPFRSVIGCFGPTNRMFLRVTNIGWFCKNVRELTVVPSKECPSLMDGLAHAANTRELWILPGVYRDSIRLTKNIAVCGAGKLGSVVIEAPGWNDALYFAGLGMDGEYVNPKTPDTGELADISNLVFRAPNPEQGFIAHIVRGTPHIHHCEIQGGLWVSGCKPRINYNTIRWSRSCGLKITDRAAPEVSGNVIRENKFGGIKVKRSDPTLARNTLANNLSYGLVITTDSSPRLLDNQIRDQLDHPKFNRIAGIYGPLETSQMCGFCGSRWARRNSFSNFASLVERGYIKNAAAYFADHKIDQPSDTAVRISEPDSSSRVSSEEFVANTHEADEAGDTQEDEFDVQPLSGDLEFGPLPYAASSSARFINHCCWVDPGEISSDDDQLYGDDDIGSL